MIEKDIPPDELDKFKLFLSNIKQFGKMQPQFLDALMPHFKIVVLVGGETLIAQDDTDRSLFVLYYGRLRLFLRTTPADSKKEPEEMIVGEISPGEIVGEMAFLIGTPRSRTVRAVRDCVLLKLDYSSFQEINAKNPQVIIDMAFTSLNRLLKKDASAYKLNISTIAIAPAGDSNHIPFTRHFASELNKIKPTIVVNKELAAQQLNIDVTQIDVGDKGHFEMSAWLYSLEQQYGYVVFETDHEMTLWTHRCIRAADKVLLIAEDGKSYDPNSIEQAIFSEKNPLLPSIDLVIVHPAETQRIVNTQKWLQGRKIYGHHHIHVDSTKDIQKIIRFMFDRALGLVLNGGGARAFAHLGVLKALDELKIPIDFIGGTSMGALMGALYAVVGIDDAIKISQKHASRKTRDVTLPMLSLLRGELATQVYIDCFESMRIEDLWTRFFCVSTNLSDCKLKIHEEGILWQAIRASTSIPAIYPPFSDEEQQILVDGAVINNMPVDIMRARISGGKILAVNSYSILATESYKVPSSPWISGWKLFFEKINPFSEKKQVDTIYNILIGSLNLAANEHQRQMEEEADYLVKVDTRMFELLEFKSVKAICNAGYLAAMEQLPILFKEHIHDIDAD